MSNVNILVDNKSLEYESKIKNTAISDSGGLVCVYVCRSSM